MKRKLINNIQSYILIIIGSIFTALSISIFLAPYKIAPGGVSGLAIIVHYLSRAKIPVSVAVFMFNIPLFILGIKYMGKKFIIRTLFATGIMSFAIAISDLYVLPQLQAELTNDLLLTAIFGGAIMGLGMAIVFRENATTGGSDLAAKIVHGWFPHYSLGVIVLAVDGAIIAIAAIVFRSFELVMYAIVAIFISSKVIDAVLEGVNFAKAIFIISDRSEEIAKKIMKELERGVTGLAGVGMYTGKPKQVLLCVVSRAQIPIIKKIARSEDESAFIMMTDIREVLGEGFMSS